MKALTNILTHTLLMLLLLMLATCTEETAEVDNLSRQEQYVSVRMNIPGMKAATTRAEDGVIETIHALAFNADKELLATRTATNINNANENDGFNGTFNITVPNGTETIHFLANVGDYDFSSVKQESDLSNLSIGDWNMLRYWGKTTTSDGNTTLNVTLYRNLAKISIMPSITDTEFNQFTQDQLKMTGFYNANERGALVPCKDGEFNFDDNSEYCTMPQDLTSDNYQLYSFTTMTAFEHENTDANPTYIICKIGDYHYKVALADDEGNRYPIIRNHHYIIYVSDVDDYAHDDNYRADTYEKAFEKLPINLEVVEAMYVDFQYDNSQALQLGNTFTVTMTVPEGGTLTDFSITAEGFTFDQPASSYSTGTYTFTFTPTGVGSKTITFTGTGSENLNNVNTTIDVNVTAAITATAKPSTIYYDGDDKTTTVSVTIPKGVSALNISAPNFEYGEETDGSYIYTRTDDATTETTVQLTFTLIDGVTNNSTIEFSATNVTSAIVNITVTNTPVVEGVIVIWESAEQNGTSIDWNRSTCRIPYQNFVERIPSLKIGDIITINYIGEGNSPSIQVEYGDSESQGTKVQIKGNGNNDNIINCDSGESSYSFEVNSDNMVEMLKKYDMVFIGSGASILSITVTPASTTE